MKLFGVLCIEPLLQASRGTRLAVRHPSASAPVLPIALAQPVFGGGDGFRGTWLDRVAAPLAFALGVDAGAVKGARHSVRDKADERSVLGVVDFGDRRFAVHRIPVPGLGEDADGDLEVAVQDLLSRWCGSALLRDE